MSDPTHTRPRDAVEQLRTVQDALNAVGMNANGIEAGIAEIEKLRIALKGLSDMYTQAWDLVDGGLLMMGPSVPRFEKAHREAQAALGVEVYDGDE